MYQKLPRFARGGVQHPPPVWTGFSIMTNVERKETAYNVHAIAGCTIFLIFSTRQCNASVSIFCRKSTADNSYTEVSINDPSTSTILSMVGQKCSLGTRNCDRVADN